MKKLTILFLAVIALANQHQLFAQAPGATCATAAPINGTGAIPGCTGAATMTNFTASGSAPAITCIGAGIFRRDGYYSFNTPGAQAITVSGTSATATTDLIIQVISGSCGAEVEIGCANNITVNSAQTETLSLGIIPAGTYYIRVINVGVAANMVMANVCVNYTSSNDDCATAVTLTPSASCVPMTGDVGVATNSGIPAGSCPTSTPDDDVWYSFVATGSSHIITVASSTNFDPSFEVFTGTCGALSSIFCNAPGGVTGTTLSNVIATSIGVQYWVRVYDYGVGYPATTTFTICIINPPPSNDDCTGAIVLAPITSTCVATANQLTGDVSGATQSMVGCAGNANDDVWFAFTTNATANQPYVITVTGNGNFDAVFQVFSTSCGGTSIACVNASGAGGTETTTLTIGVQLAIATTYWIRVYDAGAGYPSSSTFNICVTAPPVNDDCPGIVLTPGVTCSGTAGTLLGATASGQAATCGGTPNDDVFYNFVAVSTTQTITATSCPTMNIVIEYYMTSCGGVSLGCTNSTGVGGNETMTLPGLTVGATYWIRVYDFTGSSACNTFTICVTTPIVPSVTPTNASCAGICDGSAIASVTGGVGPFAYDWAGPSSYTGTGQTVTNLCVGTYTLTVTDSSNMATATTTAVVGSNLVGTFSYTGSPYCISGVNPLPTFTGGGVAGTFTASPAGLVINSSTGEVDLLTSLPGCYTVSNLIGGGGGCSFITSTASICFTVPPTAGFSYTSSPYCQSGTAIPTFTGGGVAGTFSSNAGLMINPATGVVNLTGSAIGTYIVTNTIFPVGGCPTVTATATITVLLGSVVDIGPDVTLPCGTTTYTLSTPSVFGATSYSWTVDANETITSGQGTTSITITITSAAIGALEHTVTAIGALVCPTYTSDTMYLTVNTLGIPIFSMVQDSTNAYNYWAFNPSVGAGYTYSWSFGDGGVSSLPAPTHTYALPGMYAVCLTENAGTCVSMTCHGVTVSGVLNTCMAYYNIAPDTSTVNPNDYLLTDLSYGSNLTYLWDFGDTTSSTLHHPTHVYANIGPYQLCLTVDNGAGCTQTYCDTLFAVDSLHTHLQPIAITVVGGPGSGTTVSSGELAIDNGEWIISPNPTTGIFQISNNKFQMASVKVVNVLGEIIFESTINNHQSTINLSSFAKGIYFVQVMDVNKNIFNKKIVLE